MSRPTELFEFLPLQFVQIIAYGLHYKGRITQCVLRPNDRYIYEVEYAADGDIKRGEFNADELQSIGAAQ